jgi:NAD(P)-dependent dehydrogenase (short-subunit alcohol dehydrogenase family)
MQRVHLVTGAGRGIGRAIAERLARNGAAVALLDVGCLVDGTGTSAEVATTAAAEVAAVARLSMLGGECLGISADVRDPEAIDAAVTTVLERWGRLDGVLNVAGILRMGNILTTTDDDWTSILDVHLRGPMLFSRAAITHWMATKSPGRIVNVTSTAGLEGIPEMLAYSTAKAGVIGLTMATANAAAGHGILVNAIAPHAASRMAIRGLDDKALTVRDETGAWPDVAGMGLTAERVAPLAEYLVSPGLAVTGRVFSVGGGSCARLSLPAPEVTAPLDDTMSPAEVEAVLHDTVAAGVPRSRWQLDTLSRDRSDFPVADLD